MDVAGLVIFWCIVWCSVSRANLRGNIFFLERKSYFNKLFAPIMSDHIIQYLDSEFPNII